MLICLAVDIFFYCISYYEGYIIYRVIYEDTNHLLINCPRARQVWDYFFPPNGRSQISSVASLWNVRSRSYTESTIYTAISWNIWKHENSLVFKGFDKPAMTVCHCLEDIRLWTNRCTHQAVADLLNSWYNPFDPS
jgi:hypothetical protein